MHRRSFLIIFLVFLAAGFLPVFGQVSFADTGSVDISIEPEKTASGSQSALRAEFEIPDGMYMALQEEFFFVEAELPEGFSQGPLVYPEGKEKNGLTVYKKTVVLERPLYITEDVSAGEYSITVTAGYQYCDESGTCFLPQQESTDTVITVSGPVEPIDLDPAAAGPAAGGRGLLAYLLLALVGGIILNVMPCVLPLLSVRALNLVNQAGNERKKIFVNSLFYTGGILAALLAFAGIITVLKVSGELVGWGFQFQNPVFVLALSSVIFIFALSLFDVYVLQAPGLSAASKATGKGGYAGSFFTGIFAVLVATPCSAPFLGTALGFAFSQTPAVIFLIFSLVGIGFASPFLLLGLYPGLVQKLPKPGKWMAIFKEAMGFLLIGTVIYLLNTLFHQISNSSFYRVIIFLGVLAFAAWFYGRFGHPGRSRALRISAVLIAALIIAAASVFVVRLEERSSLSAEGEDIYISEAWEVFSPEKVERYRREGVPVFIDFHAAWCTNCKINRAAVLSTDEIAKAFADFGVRLLHGDFTNNDPVIASWISHFGRGGVPVYALYIPGRENPILFPELLSKQMIIDALENNL